ncbi:MAG: hypothetical protein K0S12_2140, partial [Bacteroidetes bacterium]|nr:hypothetical protein [Bacteroidota bacterium]
MWDETIENNKYIIRLKKNSSFMEYVIKPEVTYEVEDAVE